MTVVSTLDITARTAGEYFFAPRLGQLPGLVSTLPGRAARLTGAWRRATNSRSSRPGARRPGIKKRRSRAAPSMTTMNITIYQALLPHDDPDASLALCRDTLGFKVLNLATPDLDGTFENVQAGDAEVVQEPTEQPYGIRDCSVRDPAGNLIRIQELR
jgi:Glyoxalase/Bleomycin resistance protein/Dioxygenase superfamily